MSCKLFHLFLDFQDEKNHNKAIEMPWIRYKKTTFNVFPRRMAASLRLELQDAETQQARLEATSGRQAAAAKQQAAELRQRRQVRDGGGWGVELSLFGND